MAKASKKKTTGYLCSECGADFTRWSGRCPQCGNWNSISEFELRAANKGNPTGAAAPLMPGLSLLADVDERPTRRIGTGIKDLDLVLGGGFVPGSFLLIAGEPGVGKSTLMLEIVRKFTGRVYYFSGEESPAQIKLRAQRMSVETTELYLSRETSCESVCASIEKDRPVLVIVDSVQTLAPEGRGAVGGAAQLRETALLLMEAAKTSDAVVLVTGHVTKDGNIAGPRMMEHMTDVVLYFESDRLNHYRILRAVKNRFGPVGESAIFEMYAEGLRLPELVSPVKGDALAGPGRVFSALLEGSRAIAVEVQALTTRSHFGQNRRMAEGLDTRRLILLSAVLEKYLRVTLSECDVFANLAGGLQADDPALDLAICAAMLSSYREVAMPGGAAFVGEVGLTGEVRPVSSVAARVKELASLGFSSFFVPEANRREAGHQAARGVGHVTELARLLLSAPAPG